ncbi:CvpA family protein [Gorillibacterium massiliense]|uniref:CvpA family protein n=1 Tax=Gorillibacterium massiliense TaxID=1280390 RepID=UPI001EE2D0D7|nr:CvpA family protein [Gorillibacterium massiliense]
MNVIDLIIAAALLVAFVVGYRRGMVSQLVSLVGLVLAFYIAYRYSDDLAPHLSKWIPVSTFTGYGNYQYVLHTLQADDYILRALSFALLFIAVKIVLSAVGHLLNIVAKIPGLNALNRWGGAFLGVAEAALLSAVIVYVLSVTPSDPVQKALAGSKAVPYIMDTVPELLQGIKGSDLNTPSTPSDTPAETPDVSNGKKI